MKIKQFYNLNQDKIINLRQTPDGIHLEIRTAGKSSLSIIFNQEETDELAKAMTLYAQTINKKSI